MGLGDDDEDYEDIDWDKLEEENRKRKNSNEMEDDSDTEKIPDEDKIRDIDDNEGTLNSRFFGKATTTKKKKDKLDRTNKEIADEATKKFFQPFEEE